MKRGRGFARGFSSARGKGSTPWKSDVASEETLGLVPRYLAPLVDIGLNILNKEFAHDLEKVLFLMILRSSQIHSAMELPEFC